MKDILSAVLLFTILRTLCTYGVDDLAPLSISPKPDTVIRILMDFMPLQRPILVEGFNIRTPVRKGFTVVEWGGVLRGIEQNLEK